MKKIVILTEGTTNPTDAKTATGVIRYRRDEVVAVLDSTSAGKTSQEVLGVGGDIPCVASLDEVEADTLLIGIAPAGGGLPEPWRAVIRDAIRRGLDILNGLHVFLADDVELAALAKSREVTIHDLRRPPPGLSVSKNLARRTACYRVHTVGNDCSVGKMLVALELTAALRERGRRAEFIATGQTGIMIAGRGVAIDAVVSDFISGAIESLVLESQDQEFLLIEGQGSLLHPLYSGVTLGLLHGCAPQAMVLCIDPTRTVVRHADVSIPPVEHVIRIYEEMASLVHPSVVAGVAVNTSALGLPEAEEAVDRIQGATGLPATDVVRFGTGPLLERLVALEAEERKRRGAARSAR